MSKKLEDRVERLAFKLSKANNRIDAMQAQIDAMQIQTTDTNKKPCICNSMKQVNDTHKEYQDRCDVAKAFMEWKPIAHNHLQISELNQFAWLKFAVYFAERVKGGRL